MTQDQTQQLIEDLLKGVAIATTHLDRLSRQIDWDRVARWLNELLRTLQGASHVTQRDFLPQLPDDRQTSTRRPANHVVIGEPRHGATR